MKNSIEGPNCIDPKICHGDCCSIQIDIPKVLASEYIKLKKANEEDFVRSDIFSFKLRFNESTRKCCLFDKDINGCGVHKTGIKPPQCWIYPTKFTNQNGIDIRCKKIGGWRINNIENAKKAEKILQKYNFLCRIEAKKELKLIKERINNSIKRNKKEISFVKMIQENAPKELAGIKDSWNSILPLSAEGISLQMKKFCLKYNKDCKNLQNNFLECCQICKIIAHKLLEFLENTLNIILKKEGANSDGFYPFFLLFRHLEF